MSTRPWSSSLDYSWFWWSLRWLRSTSALFRDASTNIMPWRKWWPTSEHKQSSCSEVKQPKDNKNNRRRINCIQNYKQKVNRQKQLQTICECIHFWMLVSQNPQIHTLNKKLELHRPAPARALELTCAAVELPYDAYIHTYLYSNSVIFLCNVSFVLCFCEPPSNIARIYICKPIWTSPKAQVRSVEI